MTTASPLSDGEKGLPMTQTAPAATPRRKQRWQLGDNTIRWLFVLPTLLLLLAFGIYPFLRSLYISFTQFSVVTHEPPVYIGIQNYIDLLTDEQMWIYFGTTGRYALITVALEMIVGFGMALLVRDQFKGSGFVTTLMLVPMMLSPVIVGMFWKLMLNPGFGIWNYLIGLGGQGCSGVLEVCARVDRPAGAVAADRRSKCSLEELSICARRGGGRTR